MNLVDRSLIPSLHAAARRQRSEHVAGFFRRFREHFLSAFRARPASRTAACA